MSVQFQITAEDLKGVRSLKDAKHKLKIKSKYQNINVDDAVIDETVKEYIREHGNVIIRISKGDPNGEMGLKKGAKCRMPGASGVEVNVGTSGFDSYQGVVDAYNNLDSTKRCGDSKVRNIALETEVLKHKDRTSGDIISETYQRELDTGQNSLVPGTICLNHGKGMSACSNKGPVYGLVYADAAPAAAPAAADHVSWYPEPEYPAPLLNDADKEDIDRVLTTFKDSLDTLPTQNIQKINNAIRNKFIQDGTAANMTKQYNLENVSFRTHFLSNWRSIFTTDKLLWGLYVFTHTESQVDKRIAEATVLPVLNNPETEDEYWKPLEDEKEEDMGEPSKRARTSEPNVTTTPPAPAALDAQADPFAEHAERQSVEDLADLKDWDDVMQRGHDWGIRNALGMLSI